MTASPAGQGGTAPEHDVLGCGECRPPRPTPLEFGESAVDHQKDVLRGVGQVSLGHPESAKRSPHECEVGIVDLAEPQRSKAHGLPMNVRSPGPAITESTRERLPRRRARPLPTLKAVGLARAQDRQFRRVNRYDNLRPAGPAQRAANGTAHDSAGKPEP